MLQPSIAAMRRVVHTGAIRARRAARHPFTVVAYHVAGELEMEDSGQAIVLRPGDLHVIPAGRPHRALAATDAELWGVQIVTERLDRDRFASVLAPIDAIANGASPRISLPASRRDFVASLFGELSDARPSARLRHESLVALLLGEIAAQVPLAIGPVLPDDLAGRAVAFIASHALGPLSLADVAGALGRNRSHVAEVVRRSTGRSVGDLITEVRLEDARRHLEDGDELVEVIGERVGYLDATHFARMFKRRYGMSPRAWRSVTARDRSRASRTRPA